MASPEQLLRDLFLAAVDAVSPARCLPGFLPAPPENGRTIVIGAGKAAASMAQAVEQNWQGDLTGLAVTRYGHGAPTRFIEVVEAAHPVPDAAGLKATTRMLALVDGLTEQDLVLCLISGGGSALLTAPADGLPLEDKQAVTKALLMCGATISEINCVRKHLSAIKGGRLARAAYPAQVVALLISDVPGDDPGVIASGPTLADRTTLADARRILERYAITPPPTVAQCLNDPRFETPKPGDASLARTEAHIIARASDALLAAAAVARKAGYDPVILGDDLEGEARDLGASHARLALEYRNRGQGVVLISGGETTVTVTGSGRGGRNVEYLLGLVAALDDATSIHAIACDTDGIDGSEDNAGAIVTPETRARATAQGMDPHDYLADNDAYGFFAALGDLIVTGPTRTNVNDFRAILIAEA